MGISESVPPEKAQEGFGKEENHSDQGQGGYDHQYKGIAQDPLRFIVGAFAQPDGNERCRPDADQHGNGHDDQKNREGNVNRPDGLAGNGAQKDSIHHIV
ncbi:MAG: hypothetical protein KIB49_00925 [Clostridiales bacterium]|nr:hypothetical protein [Clostridiales bacterium]